MAKKEIIKDRITGEMIYPVTHQSCIVTADNSEVVSEKVVDGKIANVLESSPEIVEAVADLKNRLNDDNDVAVSIENQIVDYSRKTFDDLWLKLVGKFGDVDHTHLEDGILSPYLANGIWLTYEEAITVRDALNFKSISTSNFAHAFKYIHARTLPPIKVESTSGLIIPFYHFCYSSQFEVIRFVNSNWNDSAEIYLGAMAFCFYNCSRLKTIYGIFNISKASDITQPFYNCSNLETLELKGLTSKLILSGCPKISYQSVSYLVKNAVNTSTVTVTVHSNVYNALIGEAEYPFNGGSQEKWTSLLEDAAQRKINFTI